MKILLAAWACNPRYGSEAAVGWTWLDAIRREHEVHVLTACYQRPWIEAEVARRRGEFSRVRFHYVEPRFDGFDPASPFWRWQRERPMLLPLFHAYYRRWQRHAYRVARELNREARFDLAHQLTFVGFRFPGYLWQLGIPFVWGPVGGLENTPWRLLPAMSTRGALYYGARNLVNSMHKRFLRTPRTAFRRARGVIAATSGIQSEIRARYGVASDVICEVGLPFEPGSEFAMRADGAPLRIAWSGMHLEGKALPLLLRALSRLPELDWRLDILGDGPCRRRWHALAARLGVAERCSWHGQLAREQALDHLRRSHLFVVTSLKDLTSTVIVEALASGVPVVCPDHCGFADAITERCGLKVPIKSLADFERGLSDAIARLGSDEAERRRLAAGALERARRFSVQEKIAAINRVYLRALARPEPEELPHRVTADCRCLE